MKKNNRIENKCKLNYPFERVLLSLLNYTGGGEVIIGMDNDGNSVL